MSKSCKKDSDCTPDGKICSGTSRRCISPDTRTGKEELKRRSSRKRSSRSSRKLSTRKRSSRSSRKLSSRKRSTRTSPLRRCPPGKILNPVTKKCVNKTGKIGQYVLRQMASLPEFKKPRPATNCIERSLVTLSPHQVKTVKAFAKTDSMVAVHEPGMGKTLTAIAVAECYLDQYPGIPYRGHRR